MIPGLLRHRSSNRALCATAIITPRNEDHRTGHQDPSREFAVPRQQFPVFAWNREFTSNVLIRHAIKPRRQAEMGKFSAILQNSLLISLLAGNCGRQMHKR